MKLYLASKSPRRRELLATLGISFEAVEPAFEEKEAGLSPVDEALYFAEQKSRSAAGLCPNSLILGCDTLIECDGKKFGQPKDALDAKRILKNLSGKTHQAHTALFLLNTKDGSSKKHVETAKVTFKKLSEEEIEEYIATGEPFGKAGAYAVQGSARKFIVKIEGDEESVIGLPTKILKQWFK